MRFACLFHQLNETDSQLLFLLEAKALGVTSETELRLNLPQRFTTNSISPEKRKEKKTTVGVYLSSARDRILNMSKRPCIYNKGMETWNINCNKELPYLLWHQNSVPQGTKERATLISKKRSYTKKKRLIKLKQNSSLQLCDKEMSFSVLALHNLCLTVHKMSCLQPITLRAKTQR